MHARAALRNEQLNAALETETVDVTLPGRRQSAGGLHPVSQALERMEQIFAAAGYAVVDGPGDRGRLSQLRSAQHSGAPSGARDARHVLFEQRARAAHAHVAGAGAGDGNPAAADSRRRVPVASIGAITTRRTARCSISSKVS